MFEFLVIFVRQMIFIFTGIADFNVIIKKKNKSTPDIISGRSIINLSLIQFTVEEKTENTAKWAPSI